MAKKIISEETKLVERNRVEIEKMRNKTFNYSPADFSIDLLTLKWKHNSWKTWCVGADNYTATKEMIKKYCKECKKQYGKRNLSFVHLA